jgi:hypothetical protein
VSACGGSRPSQGRCSALDALISDVLTRRVVGASCGFASIDACFFLFVAGTGLFYARCELGVGYERPTVGDRSHAHSHWVPNVWSSPATDARGQSRRQSTAAHGWLEAPPWVPLLVLIAGSRTTRRGARGRPTLAVLCARAVSRSAARLVAQPSSNIADPDLCLRGAPSSPGGVQRTGPRRLWLTALPPFLRRRVGGISKTLPCMGLVLDGAPSELHCRRWSWREWERRAARDCRFLSRLPKLVLLRVRVVCNSWPPTPRAQLAVCQAFSLVNCTTDRVVGHLVTRAWGMRAVTATPWVVH